ncbi:MAG: amidohydrolase family protein [Planctomycetes bacterium]|nr:amidohydrolase family protein [Planctomycetota bacterium]
MHSTAAFLLATCVWLAPATAQDKVTVLKGAKIYPVASNPIDGGIVVLQGGKIAAVGGATLAIPDGADVIDCAGKVITPGLIDAGTSLSVSAKNANEQSEEVTPHMRILDAIEPGHTAFTRVRANGVTTVQINPGNRNVIGGLGAIVKTWGNTTAEMLVKDASNLRVTLGAEPGDGNRDIRSGMPRTIYYRRPMTRMGTVWMVRKAFYDAISYREQKTVPDPKQQPPVDPGLEVLLQVLEGKLTVHTTARAEQDIRTALRIAKEFGYKTVIQGGTETWRVIDDVAEAQAKVVFSPPSLSGANNPDGAQGRLHTLNMMAERGVPFAIQTESSLGERSLAHEAMVAMRNGLSFDKALAAVTLVPAQVLGIDDRMGTLQPGKDGDVVVWSGSPFDPTSRAERVFINGRAVRTQ